MASLAVTNTFADGNTITASGHNQNNNDIVNYINDRNSGSSAWDCLKVTTSSQVPLVVNNSTGSVNIANFQDNGSNVFSIADGGNITATGVYLGPAGSNTNCAFSFSSDPNTGLVTPGADQLDLVVGGTTRLGLVNGSATISVVADLNPSGAGLFNTGSSSNYWADVSYKTLTDRGCLGWFDEGVELQDGKVVSDTEALLSIKKHPTKKTIYGIQMLDYRTFPKVAYKKAAENGIDLPRDTNDEPIGGQDGIEMTSMFSIMIGAIKELANRVKDIEKSK